jgi:hypothetical protein
MDYILELRKYIGHRPILLVDAAVLVLDEQNRLLMMKRADIACWGIPGGATEPDEVVENAVKREAKLNDEHTKWGWFAATDISEDVSPPIKPVIEQFQFSFSK